MLGPRKALVWACLIAAAAAIGGPVLRNALYSATTRRDPSWTDGSAAYLPINLLNVLDTFPANGSTQYALGSFTRATLNATGNGYNYAFPVGGQVWKSRDVGYSWQYLGTAGATARVGAASTVIGGTHMALFGGICTDTGFTGIGSGNTSDPALCKAAFSTDGTTWTTAGVAALPFPVEYGQAAFFNGRVFIVGGRMVTDTGTYPLAAAATGLLISTPTAGATPWLISAWESAAVVSSDPSLSFLTVGRVQAGVLTSFTASIAAVALDYTNITAADYATVMVIGGRANGSAALMTDAWALERLDYDAGNATWTAVWMQMNNRMLTPTTSSPVDLGAVSIVELIGNSNTPAHNFVNGGVGPLPAEHCPVAGCTLFGLVGVIHQKTGMVVADYSGYVMANLQSTYTADANALSDGPAALPMPHGRSGVGVYETSGAPLAMLNGHCSPRLAAAGSCQLGVARMYGQRCDRCVDGQTIPANCAQSPRAPVCTPCGVCSTGLYRALSCVALPAIRDTICTACTSSCSSGYALVGACGPIDDRYCSLIPNTTVAARSDTRDSEVITMAVTGGVTGFVVLLALLLPTSALAYLSRATQPAKPFTASEGEGGESEYSFDKSSTGSSTDPTLTAGTLAPGGTVSSPAASILSDYTSASRPGTSATFASGTPFTYASETPATEYGGRDTAAGNGAESTISAFSPTPAMTSPPPLRRGSTPALSASRRASASAAAVAAAATAESGEQLPAAVAVGDVRVGVTGRTTPSAAGAPRSRSSSRSDARGARSPSPAAALVTGSATPASDASTPAVPGTAVVPVTPIPSSKTPDVTPDAAERRRRSERAAVTRRRTFVTFFAAHFSLMAWACVACVAWGWLNNDGVSTALRASLLFFICFPALLNTVDFLLSPGITLSLLRCRACRGRPVPLQAALTSIGGLLLMHPRFRLLYLWRWTIMPVRVDREIAAARPGLFVLLHLITFEMPVLILLFIEGVQSTSNTFVHASPAAIGAVVYLLIGVAFDIMMILMIGRAVRHGTPSQHQASCGVICWMGLKACLSRRRDAATGVPNKSTSFSSSASINTTGSLSSAGSGSYPQTPSTAGTSRTHDSGTDPLALPSPSASTGPATGTQPQASPSDHQDPTSPADGGSALYGHADTTTSNATNTSAPSTAGSHIGTPSSGHSAFTSGSAFKSLGRPAAPASR